jgi:hypothetical protein
MKEIDRAKEIFLTDVEPETYAENLATIQEWERTLIKNQAYLGWREHQTTHELNKMVKAAMIDHAVQLGTNRNLSDEERNVLWAKQDACLFILNLTDQNPRTAIDSVMRDIRRAINATS